MARALASEGAAVALVSRDRDLLARVAADIRSSGGAAEPFVADVSREEQVQSLEQEILARFHTVNILINNAGVVMRSPIGEITLDDWRRVMDTNVTSAFLMCRSFIPYMRGQGYGRILNLTSIMSRVSLPDRAVYSSSKAALLGLTRGLALELAPECITANGISPGPFATELTRPIQDNPEVNAQFLSNIPLKRWGRPEEVGKLALYLCSEEAGFITGTDIVIDGGWTAR